MTNQPVFAQTPATEIATLTSPTAITSRANITGTTGLVKLTDLPSGSNPKRVDSILVKAKGTSLAGIISVWVYDGTTSFLFDEIDLTAVTPSTTLDSVSAVKYYTGVNLKATQQMYISSTVVQDVNVFASTGNF